MSSDHPIISTEQIEVRYGGIVAVRDVSFDMQEGDFLAVVGPNGSGKSTLIKTIMGIKHPYKGKMKKRDDLKIGYVSQHTAIRDRSFPASVEEVVSTGLLMEKKYPRRMRARDRERIKDTLQFLGVGDICKKPIGALSGGQQQRVLLGRAMVSEPDMLVLDEPTSALDVTMRRKFLRMLRHLNEAHGVTIILITHNLSVAHEYVNRVLHMDQTLLYDGPPSHYNPTNLAGVNPGREHAEADEGDVTHGLA